MHRTKDIHLHIMLHVTWMRERFSNGAPGLTRVTQNKKLPQISKNLTISLATPDGPSSNNIWLKLLSYVLGSYVQRGASIF